MTRVARGLAAAALATFVAAFSHVAAGRGAAPGTAGLALSIAFSAVVCVLLTRRSLSLPLLTLSVALSQVVFHLLFGVGAGNGSGLVVASHEHHGLTVSTLVPDPQHTVDAVAGSHAHDSSTMWLAHVLAGVITVVALRNGELVLRRLLALGHAVAARRELVTAAVRALVRAVSGTTGLRPAAPRILDRAVGLPVPDRLRDLGVVLGSLRHRGPPRVALTHLPV